MYSDKNKCLVSSKEKINKWYAHKDVCKDLPVDFDGYCVLHYPDDNKCENTNFEEIYNEKLANNDYKFDYVYFPKVIFLEEKIFENKVSFNSAIFRQSAFFRFSEFKEEVDFNCAVFEGANFQKANFHKDTSFRFAKFSEIYEPLLPPGYELNGADFRSAIFAENIDFTNSEFFATSNFSKIELNKEIFFQNTKFFNNCYFNQVNFKDGSTAFFDKTLFSKAISFNYAYLNGHISFIGDAENLIFGGELTRLGLQHTKIKKPENIGFHSVLLFPHWFVNSDSRKFIFSDVVWKNSDPISIKKNIKAEKLCIESFFGIKNSTILLSYSLRHLATNYQDNDVFEQASIFRRMAFEAEWFEKKEKILNWIKNLVPESEKLKSRFGGSDKEEDKPIPPTNSFGILRRSGDFFIHGLYRITSFYGESWSWALGVLLSLILVIFPIIYTQINFQTCSKDRPIAASLTICESKDEEIRKNCTCSTDQITFTDAIVQSLTTATLQNVEYRKPLTIWGELWIILEKIFAPLQAALLALAIRRKFMR